MTSLSAISFPINGNKLIEASAGTGKTYTITNLYLRILLGHNIQRPLLSREILVLTFTIAATDELRSRIRTRVAVARDLFSAALNSHDIETLSNDDFLLQLLRDSSDLDRDRKLLSHALLTMDEAAIFTIHGFCAHVLSEQSFETGHLFNQKMDADQNELLKQSAEDCFRNELLNLPNRLQGIALNLWPSPTRLLQAIKPIIYRDQVQLEPEPRDVSQALDNWIDNIERCKVMWLESNASTMVREASFHGARNTVKKLDEIDAYCASDSTDIDLWQHWQKGILEKNATKKTVMPVHPVFDLVEDIWQARSVVDQVEYKLWHQVIDTIRSRMTDIKTRLSLMTMDDLLKHVHGAIKTNTSDTSTPDASNNDLAAQLRQKWPIAMIDEFQDTDDLQYGIFDGIYNSAPDRNESPDQSQALIFIGDPKQAIYQFRGADIYTYINAKRQINDELYSLDTNWRSSATMVEATNCLFSSGSKFGNGDDINFTAAKVSPTKQDACITLNGEPTTAFHVTTLQQNKASVAAMRSNLIEDAAETCAQLLDPNNQYQIEAEPIVAGQIAFLVRRHSEAAMVQAALSKRLIKSVYMSHNSVFDSSAARDLLMILEAILEPSNDRLLRRALATELLQLSLSDIAALDNNPLQMQKVTEEFIQYQHKWQQDSLAAMMAELISKRHIAHKWLALAEGERQITNLRHLTELLQQRSLEAPGGHRLIKWFKRAKSQTNSIEADQIRLESDQHLVKIVTMHASKGLEYDIVLIPLIDAASNRVFDATPPLYHRQTTDGAHSANFVSTLDLSRSDEAKQQADIEQQEEDMRLLYVAITRAKYQCWVGLPLLDKAKPSAASKLFGLDLAVEAPQFADPIDSLPSELFEHHRLDPSEQVACTPCVNRDDQVNLVAPKTRPFISDSWRMHSYTGISRILMAGSEHGSAAKVAHAKPAPLEAADPGVADDDVSEQPDTSGQILQPEYSRFSYPRGAKVGVALHDLLEHLDFGLAGDVEALYERCVLRSGIFDPTEAAVWLGVLRQWVPMILNTPLTDTLKLADIKTTSRLDEMEFHFPMDMQQSFIDVIQEANYLKSDHALQLRHLRGIMTGFIDLVFEADGKYYIVDYKSNHLGSDQSDYLEQNLSQAIAEHQYDLQYLIYTLALHRYLARRVPNYDYETHMGGAFYVFLRGMDGKQGHGVHADKPPLALIEKMSNLLQEGNQL